MATILVVDDEQVLCDLLKEELSKHGHEVRTATGGHQGIEQFTQHRPHLTLLDLRMPEMSGIEVLRRIRALDPQARVIMLTGGGGTAVWEKQARELGVTEFLHKEGVSLKDLVGALGKALQQHKETATATILVVGDEQMVCDLLKEELSKYGHEVRTATGGHQGIEQFAQHRPHLTLLDLRMSGIVVLKRIRALDPQARVIMLTGEGTAVWEKRARELGVTEYLHKEGVSLKELVGALGKALQQSAGPMGGTGESPPP